jgi:lysophospholipase L1-like esterase
MLLVLLLLISSVSIGAGPPGKVVCIGDSITMGTISPELSYPALLARYCQAEVINKGVSGQETPQMLERFEEDVLSLKPSVVVVMGGTNDVAQGVPAEKIVSNLRGMYQEALDRGIVVIACTIPPANVYDPHQKEVRKAVNEWIGDLEVEGVLIAPTGSAIEDSNCSDGLTRAYDSGDGLHPNQLGYEAIAKAVEKALVQCVCE